jgi:predicted PurR-regulated permease PerM
MGMFIMKVKHPVLLALLITVVDALPIFGSGFFLWPWAVYCIIQKEIFNLIVIILVYAAIQFIRSVVQNRIMSSDYGLNAVMTIFILFVGFKLYGFVGLIFAIPVGVLIMSLYKFGIFDNFILSIKKLFLYTKMFLEQNL